MDASSQQPAASRYIYIMNPHACVCVCKCGAAAHVDFLNEFAIAVLVEGPPSGNCLRCIQIFIDVLVSAVEAYAYIHT